MTATLAENRGGRVLAAPIWLRRGHGLVAPLLLLAVWLTLVLILVHNHVFWRDEVRALTIASDSPSLGAMFGALHYEGHPALWYLLLRGAHALIGDAALPVMALGIGVAAAVLLIWRSPFPLAVVAALLLTKFMVFEYVVMARNYGLSMLLMFAFAALYPRGRTRGVWLGLILALLANSNVHSALLAPALMAVWAVDIVREHGLQWSPALRTLLLNAAILAVGLIVCAWSILPSTNEVAAAEIHGDRLHLLMKALFNPGANFREVGALEVPGLLVTAICALALLGLAPRVSLMLAGLGALVGLSALFGVVYYGYYRHQALWLAFLVTLYWLRWAPGPEADSGTHGPGARHPWMLIGGQPRQAMLQSVGMAALAVLIGAQVLHAGLWIRRELVDPAGSAQDLGRLVDRDPALRSAVVIGDSDLPLGSVVYYAPNPVFRLRDGGFGPVFRFTSRARLSLSLAELLAAARGLQASQHRDVLILMDRDMDPKRPPEVYSEARIWTFSTTPGQVRDFLAATRLLLASRPTMIPDEQYAVYLLRPAAPGRQAGLKTSRDGVARPPSA